MSFVIKTIKDLTAVFGQLGIVSQYSRTMIRLNDLDQWRILGPIIAMLAIVIVHKTKCIIGRWN